MQDQVQSEKRSGGGIAPEKVRTEQHLAPTATNAFVKISEQPEKLVAETNKSSCDVGKTERANENVPNMETQIISKQAPQDQAGSKDDPKLYEEIIKEISALDEMLEQYNDTSLPYITEFETSCGDSLQPTTDEIAVTDSQLPVSAVHVVPHQKQQQAHSQSSSVSNLVAVNDNSSIILPETVLHSSSSSTSSPMNGNKVVDQNQNLDWSEERVEGRNNNGPIIHTSHLIQIPVVEQPPTPTNGTFKTHSNNTRTFHSVSTSTSSSSSSSSSAGEMNGNSIHNGNERHQHQPKRKGKGSGGDGGATTTTPAVPASGGGTYSKGTSYEILIPKITSGSFVSRDSSISSGKGTITTSSHSNRASIMVPVIESQDTSNNTQNGGKVRPQLNMGIFQPNSSSQDASSSSQGTNVLVHTKDIHTTHVPVSEAGGAETSETHVGGGVIENNGGVADMNQQNHHNSNSKYSKGANGNGSVSSTYITVSEGKSSLGQSSSGTVSSAVMMMMRGDEEQWNFPSDKNLPRSLRKTRKTCFLDEGEQGDGKLRARAESPYCDQSNGLYASSDHSVSSSDQCNYVSDVNGRNGSCHKSPRVMPRKGIPSKCEIINKGDGNFALEGPNKQIWNGLQNQQPQQHHQQPHTTVVSTSSLSSGSKEMGRSDRKKIYEDVVLRSQAASSDKLKKPGSTHHSVVANNSSPSSTFTSSSGVSLSVRSNLTLEEEPIQRGKSSNHHHPGKSRKGYHHHPNELQQQQQQTQTQQQQQPAPKPRVRQQIPSPGTEVPVPGTNLVTPQNQFIPSFANGRQSHHQDPYQSQISCTPITMSSHHSPDPVEIGTEEAHRDEPQHFAGRDVHLSSTSSPIKICHPHSLIKSCVDAEFGEIGDNLGKTGGDKAKARRGSRKGELNHSMSGFEPVGQEDSNGSLPNQSQMMRMMMMMKSSAKNSVGSASSSSRSSSSSGSVSVKSSSSSSENNCADVFHENIVQDYPTNIFNVAAAVADQDARSGGGSPRGRKVSKEETNCKLIDEIGIVNTNAEKSNGGGGVNNAVVVMRAKISGSGRGNLQQNANQTGNKKNVNGGGNGGGSANQGNNSTLDIDDGYLSMINRNEAPLLWPEEFIENETFSRDEMKRLSVHLNDDETDDGGSSNSHSPPHPKTKKGGEKEGSSPNKSEFATCNPNRNSMSGSSSNTSSGHEQNRRNRRERAHVPGRSSTEKTDYFSDDSLEMEGDDEMLLQSGSDNIKTNGSGKQGNSSSPTAVVVRPSTSFIIPFNTKEDDNLKVEPVESQTKKDEKVSQIRKSNSQVSRIPKMVSPASSNRRSSAGNNVIQKRDSFTKASSHSGGSSPTSGFPKPCSFFIPFSTETQTNDGNAAVTKMSASTGDNYVVNSAVSPVNVPSVRSTSLPSSRRNSSASSSENKTHRGHHAAIAWNISSSPDDDNKLRQQQNANKASAPDNYLIDSRNKSEDVGAASHPSNKIREQLNGLKKEEEKVTVDAEGSISIEGANKLDFDEINPSATTTTSNTNSSGGAKTGDSMSKRAKFQKQQTFLVSPSSRETTTSSDGHGQRLIDPDNQSTTPSQDTALLLTIATTHQNEQCNNNNDQTPDKTATTEHNQLTFMDNNKENDSAFQSQTDQESFEGKVRNGNEKVNVNGEGMRNAKAKANCDQKNMRTELNTSSTISHDDNHSPQNYASRNYTFSENDVVVVNGGNSWEFDGKQGFDKGVEEEDNQNKLLENQESVAEELESVVKMFLKATADLLHPKEEEVEESASTKGKSESDRSSCGNLKCEPGRVGDSLDDSQKQASVVIECSGDVDDDDGIMLSELTDYENGSYNQGESGNVQKLLADNISSLSDAAAKQPLMTSTPLADRSSRGSSERKKRRELDGTSPIVRKENSSSAIGGDKRLSFLMLPETTDEEEAVIEDLHEQPPAFIPEPPPVDVIAPIRIVAPPHANIVDTSSTSSSSIHPSHLHNLEGKVALDLLSQRITRKCPSPVENMSVSQFLHNKKNIWAMYDRPYDEDVLPPSFPRGFASRSQENLVDAMTHERLTKSFSARGQSSTLPLNCRPPPVQRRTSTFRNMFNKFRKHKTTDTVIPEGPELRDEEAQSITSRETGPSEGKKRGFFSRLFRRSRKH